MTTRSDRLNHVPGRRPRVVIIGGGFGGLRLARRLRRAPVEVTLIDQKNYHTFLPLLYEVATAGLSPGDIAQPFRALLRNANNASFMLATVERVDLEQRRVITSGGPVSFDVLLLAFGTTTNTFGVDGAEEHARGLKDMNDAAAIRNGILRNFERASVASDAAERERLMTVVVVGGGPTGVEIAGALAELRHHVLRRDFPALDMRQARVLLLEAAGHLLPAFPESLRRKALAHLGAMGVDVRLNAAVTDVTPDRVSLKDGSTVESANIVWVAGTKGSPLAATLGVTLSRDGRVPVNDALELPAHPGVYAIGDIAFLTDAHDKPYPMLAQVALQQADLVADNIQRRLRGEPPRRFRYRDRGIMATIGRRRAVALIKGLRFSGTVAWFVWLVVHLMAIISLRNRLLVFVNWVWNYIRYDRASRLITDDFRDNPAASQPLGRGVASTSHRDPD